MTTLEGAPRTSGPTSPRPDRASTGLGRIVALTLVSGCMVALLLVAAPFIPVEESAVTGAVLCGFASGWAALFLVSSRFSAEPQQWAAVPAIFMAVSGLLLVLLGSPVREVLSWVWPPALVVMVIWMVCQTHRRMGSRSGRVQLYLVFAVLALSAVGGGYETVQEARDTNAMPTTGSLIDVGGHRLYLNCVGSGTPTVVLEPGGGGTSSQLAWISSAVARGTRVCVYDRAGRGWSEPSDNPQDGAQIATDLHTLLHRGGVTGPYVVAGHSFGGLYVRIFAARYPDEVAGLVLMDSTAAQAPARSVVPSPASSDSYDFVGRVSALTSLSARLGLTRAVGVLDFGTLPPHSRDEARASVAQAAWVRSTVEEYLRAGASAQQAASLRDLSDKPLVVLTAGEGHPASWMATQQKMLSLSTNSAHRIVAGATHTGMIVEEEYAAATARAILDVADSVRTHRPLNR